MNKYYLQSISDLTVALFFASLWSVLIELIYPGFVSMLVDTNVLIAFFLLALSMQLLTRANVEFVGWRSYVVAVYSGVSILLFIGFVTLQVAPHLLALAGHVL